MHYTGPRLPVKAKRVISLFMPGGPSHVDLFDPKPGMVKYAGQRPNAVDLRTERQTGGLFALIVCLSQARAERRGSE